MKYTFKKRPKLRKVYGSPSIQANEDLNMLIEDYNKLNDWLEGLEKELRQSLLWTETKWHPKTWYHKGMKQECVMRIKEILGEN